jgi:hypothetical protein
MQRDETSGLFSSATGEPKTHDQLTRKAITNSLVNMPPVWATVKQDFLNTVDTSFHELGVTTPTNVNPLDEVNCG